MSENLNERLKFSAHVLSSLGYNTHAQDIRSLQAKVETYQTAFDWSGLKSWAETIVEEWKSSSGIERNRMYASMKVAEKLLVGIALLSKEGEIVHDKPDGWNDYTGSQF